MNHLPPPDEMWSAFLRRDAAYDGLFFTAVRTTGIFCRPTCPARKPRRENVEFFPSVQQAMLAGYRACRRCRPAEPATAGAEPAWAGRLVEMVERTPRRRLRDGDLRAMDIDPAGARRHFKARYGMTFHAYQRAARLGSALGHIRAGGDLTGVGYDHGYESASGFREAFERLFGEAPGRARRNGRDALVVRWMQTELGPFIAAATAEGVCLFEFAERRALETQIAAVSRRFGRAAVPGVNEHLERLDAEFAEYLAQRRRAFTVPLITRGTPFQELVWSALREIPCGETRSYDDLARTIGRPGAQRAVGRANGQNRIAVLIPCHRVIRHDGTLGGYGGGRWRKQALLELERALP